MVKVSGSKQLLQAARSKPSSSGGGNFIVTSGKNISQSGSLNETGAITPPATLRALIALQEGGDEGEGQKNSTYLDWSANTISLLEDLQRELLSGKLTKTSLEAVAHQLQAHLKGQAPPLGDDSSEGIVELQAQILLRARVELAKLER